MLKVTYTFSPDRFRVSAILGERSGQVVLAGILTNRSCNVC